MGGHQRSNSRSEWSFCLKHQLLKKDRQKCDFVVSTFRIEPSHHNCTIDQAFPNHCWITVLTLPTPCRLRTVKLKLLGAMCLYTHTFELTLFKTILPRKWPFARGHLDSQKTNLRQIHDVMRPQEEAKCSVFRYMRGMCNPQVTLVVSSPLEKPGKPPKQGYPEDTNQMQQTTMADPPYGAKLILDPLVTTPLRVILCVTPELLPKSPHCTCLARRSFHRRFMLEISGIISPPQVCS